MIWILQWYANTLNNGGTSQGLLFLQKDPAPEFFCHSLGDEARPDKKVSGETRLRAGLWPIEIRKEDTNLTLKHRIDYAKAGWKDFKFHLEIKTPDFVGTYVHAGIDQKHTDGCLLLMDSMGNVNVDVQNQGARSLQAVRRWYEAVYPFIEGGGKAFLEIRDEIKLK